MRHSWSSSLAVAFVVKMRTVHYVEVGVRNVFVAVFLVAWGVLSLVRGIVGVLITTVGGHAPVHRMYTLSPPRVASR